MTDLKFKITEANYTNAQHAEGIGYLMECYSSDPAGGGSPISEEVKASLASELGKIAGAFSIICYLDNKAVGLINCLPGFSTFKCKPLINIHDVVVVSDYRGQGISQLMLERVEQIALQRGCCKLTLEVLEGNQSAQKSYSKFGFSDYQLDPEMGRALFWEKEL